MEYRNILFETTPTQIGILTINRPKVLNALNIQTFEEINHLLDRVETSPVLRGLIITGVERSFVAGADLNECIDAGIEENSAYAKLAQSTFDRIANLPIPTIAAVNGFALGGGCELSLSCDIRIAARNAKFGQPEVKLGVIPCFGGTQRLPRLVGVGVAKELIFGGENISAERALEIGLVNQVVEKEELLDTAVAKMERILKNSSTAIKYAKAAIDQGAELPLASALELERYLSSICYGLPDKQEGMAAFMEKRQPEFK